MILIAFAFAVAKKYKHASMLSPFMRYSGVGRSTKIKKKIYYY